MSLNQVLCLCESRCCVLYLADVSEVAADQGEKEEEAEGEGEGDVDKDDLELDDCTNDFVELEMDGESGGYPKRTSGPDKVISDGAAESKREESVSESDEGGSQQQQQPEDAASTDESEENYVQHSLTVSHLNKFKLPENYPQTIADIIRSLTLEDSLLDTLRPKLTQTLRIR
jgi:hypothetical protein